MDSLAGSESESVNFKPDSENRDRAVMAQKADSETLKLDSDHRRWPCRREVNKEESLDHAGVSVIRVY